MLKTLGLVTALVLAGVHAQSGAWQQCGGINYSGSTTCVSGYTCTYLNDYYSQCVPGSSSQTTTSTSKTTSSSSTSKTSQTSKTTGTTTLTSKTTTTATTTTTAGASTGTQIRTDQDPVFHLYLQDQAGQAVLGDVSTSGYFTINGSIKLNGPNLYLNIADGTASYRQLTLDATATFTGWQLEGDTIITSQSSTYGRQLNFLVCQTTTSGVWSIYLQLGNDLPPGQTCSNDISLHLPCLC